MKNLNIAYIQADLKWEDKAANLQRFGDLLKQVQPNTDLILMPETFTTAFPVDPKQFAEKEDGPTMQWLKNQAQTKKRGHRHHFSFRHQRTLLQQPRLDAP